MKNEIVSIVKDDGHRSIWAWTSHFYRKDGKKKTPEPAAIGRAAGVFFAITFGWLLLRGTPESDQASGPSPIQYGSDVATDSVKIHDVPFASANGVAAKRVDMHSSGRSRPLPGLQLVTRPRVTQVPPGLAARARLIMGASDGLTKVKLIEDVEVNGEVLIERDSTLIGHGSSSDERLMIRFSKLVFKDGTSQTVNAQAHDGEDKMAGLRGSKLGKYAVQLAAGVGLNFIGGVAEGLQESENKGGIAVKKNDLRNAALNGAAKASIDQSKEIISQWKEKRTVIQVKEGTEILVMFDGE